MITAKLREKRLRRKVREREKRHRRQRGQRFWKAARARRAPQFARVIFPAELALVHWEHRRGTLRACAAIREDFLRDGRDIILDFSRTRRIKAEAMLLIVAELDRAIRMADPSQVVRCKLPDGDDREARVVREVLDQIGLLDRIGYPKSARQTASEYDETVRHWRYATGTRVDEEPGDVLEEYEGQISTGLMKSVQIGLSEALINSLHHAYEADREDGCSRTREKRWWMFTHERDGMISVHVCDLGIGISRSLPLKWDRAFLKKLFSFLPGTEPEVAAIRIALILGESSTGDEHRGRGLPQIWNATRSSSAGGVGIHSGRAYVSFNSESKKDAATQFASSILGTLVSWSFSVEAADGDNG